MTKQIKLKPCPFCGSEKVILEDDMQEVYWVLCFECNATGPPKNTEAEAFEAWNKRVEKEQPNKGRTNEP